MMLIFSYNLLSGEGIILVNKKQILTYLKFTTIAIIVMLILNFVIGILFLDNSSLVGVIISKYKLDKYSKAVYGEEVFSNGLPRYNLKDGVYEYTLVTPNNEFVSGLSYEVSKDKLKDSSFIVEFDILSEIEIIDNELGEDIYLPRPDIFYWIDGNQDFSKKPLKRIDKLYLLGIRNTNVELTAEQSREELFAIISYIYKRLGNKYNFTSSQIIYTDINGTLETNISAKESLMPYEKIKSRIKSVKQEAELDMKFINQLRDVKSGKLSKDKL